MIGAILALGAAGAGLFVFRLRSLHRSVLWAAIAIVLLVLIALAHSLSLYVPNLILQAGAGPFTVSRFLEEQWAWGFGLAALVAPVVNALVSVQNIRARP